jgi:hypothetical protein
VWKKFHYRKLGFTLRQGRQVAQAIKFLYGGAKYLWLLSMEIAWSFEVALGFLEIVHPRCQANNYF